MALPSSIALRPAADADLTAIERLLQEAGLPAGDVSGWLEHFVVAESDGETIGCAGFELHGRDALFRSLVIAPPYRGLGVSRRLMESLETEAARRGVQRAWGLTLSIPELLERWGFSAVPRDSAPAPIRATDQFTRTCSSAPLFLKNLG